MLQKLLANAKSKLQIKDLNDQELILSNKFINKLRLDNKPHYIKKAQLAGEKDIQTLAKKKGYKEAEWYFLPESSLWLSTTIGNSIKYNSDTREATLSLEGRIPKFSEFAESNIIHYHFHPIVIHNQLAREHGNNKATLITALPTLKDIEAYKYLIEQFPESNFSFKIITAFSITNISIQKSRKSLDMNKVNAYINESLQEIPDEDYDFEIIIKFLANFNNQFKGLINLKIETL